jgi:hypothetical protein
MNKAILTHAIAAIAATLTVTATAGPGADQSKSKTPEVKKSVVTREEFGTFLGWRPYSQTLGLSLWNSNQIYEVHEDVDIKEKNESDSTLSNELETKVTDKLAAIARGSGSTFLTDYSKLKLGIYLGFEDNTGSAILLRVRNRFQLLNEDATEAKFSYLDDRKAKDSGGQVEAAVMFDFYLDALYNKPWGSPFKFIKNPYRFWIRTGFEINKNDLPGVQEVDQRKFFALLNFQANPDQDLRIKGSKVMAIDSPQIVQLGVEFERNELSGEESTHWIVGWAPLMNVLDNGNGIFNGFGLNKRMYFGKKKENATESTTATITGVKPLNGADGKPQTAVNVTPNESCHYGRFYTSINPTVTMLGQSDARGIYSEAQKRLLSVRSLQDLEKLREEQFRWEVRAILGYDDGMLELSYAATGCNPLSDFGTLYFGQEVRLDLDVAKWCVRMAKGNRKPEAAAKGVVCNAPSKDWQNFKAYVSYKRGQFEPTYTDVDLVSAGFSLRF